MLRIRVCTKLTSWNSTQKPAYKARQFMMHQTKPQALDNLPVGSYGCLHIDHMSLKTALRHVCVFAQAITLDNSQLEFAQMHLRILSGLYGMLMPLDAIKPYRLCLHRSARDRCACHGRGFGIRMERTTVGHLASLTSVSHHDACLSNTMQPIQ